MVPWRASMLPHCWMASVWAPFCSLLIAVSVAVSEVDAAVSLGCSLGWSSADERLNCCWMSSSAFCCASAWAWSFLTVSAALLADSSLKPLMIAAEYAAARSEHDCWVGPVVAIDNIWALSAVTVRRAITAAASVPSCLAAAVATSEPCAYESTWSARTVSPAPATGVMATLHFHLALSTVPPAGVRSQPTTSAASVQPTSSRQYRRRTVKWFAGSTGWIPSRSWCGGAVELPPGEGPFGSAAVRVLLPVPGVRHGGIPWLLSQPAP
ncbi:hypothetical protein [Streptomyces sp. CB01881]|uniref:hypothetical protein n=1 Tax=Streptomyces sp. CB01881 TaxID=2078691 RepID=UPI0013A52E57|nr:hypothetical protein [Streptomyces sp. CB01881]